MMTPKTFAILCAASLTMVSLRAFAWDPFVSENGDVADGNEYLAKEKYADALESYGDAARSLPDRNEIHLNRGLALLRMGDDKLDQAMQALTLASEPGPPDDIRARSFAALGNAFFRKEDYKTAMSMYKRSLMLAPGNKDTAWNYEVAKQRQKEKEEQEQENQTIRIEIGGNRQHEAHRR